MSFTIGAALGGALLLGAQAARAQDGAALFKSICTGCHNDVNHPADLVYNAAGNVAIIEAVNAFGMGASGSLADHTSIAAYLKSVKPTITLAPVAHDSPGTVISLHDIIVSGAQIHASWQIISEIVTVSPPTKGTVSYHFKNGFGEPSRVAYTPFPGQSGIDTWTYQGIGARGSTTVRTASVYIAPAAGLPGSPDLDQHGLTGSWYEAVASGQGFEVEVYPDLSASGTGLAQVSWFTFDTVAGGADHQRWYTLSGPVTTGRTSVDLAIYQNIGGNFNSPPTTSAHAVGAAMLAFDSCTSGLLTYAFTDGSGLTGAIPLSRIAQNVTCSTTGARPTDADFALSGNWYDPATAGQGFTIEVNAPSATLFFAWYTYAPDGAAAGAAGQRWFTGQGAFTPGKRSIPVTLYATTGGVFDSPAATPQSAAVGTATLAFQDCSHATLSYTFTADSSSGMSGSINLSRIGPIPAGCG